jgi:hypothetical protein
MNKELVAIDPAFWAELEEKDCPCEGQGWADISGKTEQCPIHFQGQLHPDSFALLYDEPDRLREEERKSMLRWKIEQARQTITELQASLKEAQKSLVHLELELINKTPTIKMQAVNPQDPLLDVDEVHWDDVFPMGAE